VEGCAGEEVRELHPDLAGEGGLGTCTEDEDTYGGWGGPEAFDVEAGAGARGMDGVAEGCRCVSKQPL